MKRKIFCLAICVLCIVAALVSCNDAVACEGHADTDKNAACDNCGAPVVILTEEVTKEEAIVEMVVSKIPEGATIGTAYAVTLEKDPVLGTEFTENDLLTNGSTKGRAYDFIFISYEEQTAGADTEENQTDDEFKITWSLYNPYTDKTVTLHTCEYDAETSSKIDEVELDRDLSENGIIKIDIYDYIYEEDNDYWRELEYSDYYTVAGTKFTSSLSVTTEEDYTSYGIVSAGQESTRDGITYFVSHNTKYAIDVKTGVVLHEEDKNYFVERPTFDFKDEKYGYVEGDFAIYAYDLTKWLECVYSYEVPSYYLDGKTHYLGDGKILMEGIEVLPANSVNYDLFMGAEKMDIEYTLIDLASETKEKEIEFGYLINNVQIVDDMADAVKYIFDVNAIENKQIAKALTLYLDASLNILAEDSAILPAFVNDLELVADGVFLGTVVYGEYSSVRKLYDATGKEIVTLPNSAVIKENWIEFDGKYYDFTMKLIFDPKADEENVFTVFNATANYIFFRCDDDTYYWNATMTAPKLVADNLSEDETTVQSIAIYGASNYFVVRTTKTVEEETENTFALYNANGEFVFESDVMIKEVTFAENADGAYFWGITLYDDTVYIGR